jgi:hypothetical protein
MMDTEHTPLPWARHPHNNRICHVTDHGSFDVVSDDPRIGDADAALIVHSVNLLPELVEALSDLHAFVAIIFGRGDDASIPETITTPLGVPVKIGAIMRDAESALSKAKATS